MLKYHFQGFLICQLSTAANWQIDTIYVEVQKLPRPLRPNVIITPSSVSHFDVDQVTIDPKSCISNSGIWPQTVKSSTVKPNQISAATAAFLKANKLDYTY